MPLLYQTFLSFSTPLSSHHLFIEASHLNLPQAFYDCQQFQQLMLSAGYVGRWHNDLYSFRKELASEDVNNLVMVLQRTHQCPLQKAVDRAAELTNEEVRHMLAVEQRLPSFSPETDQNIQSLLKSLHYWISGNMGWCGQTRRYGELEDVIPGQDAAYVEDLLC